VGRITRRVAHERENPLNSMRLWLGKLEGITPGGGRRRVAAKQCKYSTGDRPAGRGRKTFLDFTRPMDIRLEATQLAELFEEFWKSRSPSSEDPTSTSSALAIDGPRLRGPGAAQERC